MIIYFCSCKNSNHVLNSNSSIKKTDSITKYKYYIDDMAVYGTSDSSSLMETLKALDSITSDLKTKKEEGIIKIKK